MSATRIALVVSCFGLLSIGFIHLSKPTLGTGSTGPDNLDHGGLPVVELSRMSFNRSQRLGLPGDLLLVGDRLVVVDLLGEPALHVVDKHTGTLISSRGRDGEGPGEFRAPVSLLRRGAEEALWIYDVELQRLTKVALAQKYPHVRIERTLLLRAEAPVIQPVWTAPDRMLAYGFFFKGRLAEFNAQGDFLRHTGQLPPNPRGVPNNVLQHAYQGTLATQPDGAQMVLANRHAGVLEIYNGDGELLRLVMSPFTFSPRFSVQEGEQGYAMATGPDLRFGYIDVTATQEYIYALFSGRTAAGFPASANYADYVHVFDWDGEFLEAWRLGADTFTITVDEEENLLYATQHLPTPAVLRYQLAGTVLER